MIEKKNNFKIEYTRGDTYALQMTFKNVTQDLTQAFFTVKENIDDEQPLIEKTIGAGITKINENFYKQQIVYKLQLQAEDSRNLQVDFPYLYDLKIAVGNVIKTAISGNFIVKHNVTGVDRITTELADIEVDDFIDTDAETTPATSGIEYEQDPVARMLIGDLDNLTTTHKETVVDAINDNKSSITALETTTSEHDTQLATLNGYFTDGKANEAIQSTNADNAIKNNDDTYSGLTTDENGVLKVGNIIIPQKQLLWDDDQSFDSTIDTEITLDTDKNSHFVVEVSYMAMSTGNTYTIGVFDVYIKPYISEQNVQSFKYSTSIITDAFGNIIKLLMSGAGMEQTGTLQIVGVEYLTNVTGSLAPVNNWTLTNASLIKIYKVIE